MTLFRFCFVLFFTLFYVYKQQSIPTTISNLNANSRPQNLDRTHPNQNNKSNTSIFSSSTASSAFCCSCLKKNSTNSFSKFRFSSFFTSSSSSSSSSSSYFSVLPSFSPVKLIISALLLTNTALLAESSSILSNTLHHLTLQYPSGS